MSSQTVCSLICPSICLYVLPPICPPISQSVNLLSSQPRNQLIIELVRQLVGWSVK